MKRWRRVVKGEKGTRRDEGRVKDIAERPENNRQKSQERDQKERVGVKDDKNRIVL